MDMSNQLITLYLQMDPNQEDVEIPIVPEAPRAQIPPAQIPPEAQLPPRAQIPPEAIGAQIPPQCIRAQLPPEAQVPPRAQIPPEVIGAQIPPQGIRAQLPPEAQVPPRAQIPPEAIGAQIPPQGIRAQVPPEVQRQRPPNYFLFCERHPNETLNLICIQDKCPKKGIICCCCLFPQHIKHAEQKVMAITDFLTKVHEKNQGSTKTRAQMEEDVRGFLRDSVEKINQAAIRTNEMYTEIKRQVQRYFNDLITKIKTVSETAELRRKMLRYDGTAEQKAQIQTQIKCLISVARECDTTLKPYFERNKELFIAADVKIKQILNRNAKLISKFSPLADQFLEKCKYSFRELQPINNLKEDMKGPNLTISQDVIKNVARTQEFYVFKEPICQKKKWCFQLLTVASGVSFGAIDARKAKKNDFSQFHKDKGIQGCYGLDSNGKFYSNGLIVKSIRFMPSQNDVIYIEYDQIQSKLIYTKINTPEQRQNDPEWRHEILIPKDERVMYHPFVGLASNFYQTCIVRILPIE